MYNIEIYEDAKGRSDIQELLEDLHRRAPVNKDARINSASASLCEENTEDPGEGN